MRLPCLATGYRVSSKISPRDRGTSSMQVPPSATIPIHIATKQSTKRSRSHVPKSDLIGETIHVRQPCEKNPEGPFKCVVLVCEDRKKKKCAAPTKRYQFVFKGRSLNVCCVPRISSRPSIAEKAIIVIAKPNQVTSRNASLLFWAPFPDRGAGALGTGAVGRFPCRSVRRS